MPNKTKFKNTDRLLLAGTHSGAGKTTLSTAILAALKAKGVDLAAFKAGPDYVDPMFHREVLDLASYNLDPFFMAEEQLKLHLAKNAAAKLAVIEGVMGYYDGIGIEGRASSYELARASKTPVILVLNVKGMYSSAAAQIYGYLNYRPESQIAGVIFNACSAMLYPGLKKLALELGVKPLGYLEQKAEYELPDRRLGLVSAAEISDLKERLELLGRTAAESLDLRGIIELAKSAPEITVSSAAPQAEPRSAQQEQGLLRLAVARDAAFCFIYQENLDFFKEQGVELVFFSPLVDQHLADNIQGLYLPGGYPELYLPQLAANRELLRELRQRLREGLPCLAEAGGFIYLHEQYEGVELVGAVAGQAFDTPKLQRFGYITLTAEQDNLLAKKGESIRAHEFHYTDSDNPGTAYTATRAANGKSYPAVVASPRLFAGFPQIYLPANPSFGHNFIRAMQGSQKENGADDAD
ncbi:MAG: cobyrinate a,c-diamide synthase [Eubacteriales bacterium]|nr:cobyrinate a,c-diamide synthase [Eubacteriales bacterium]